VLCNVCPGSCVGGETIRDICRQSGAHVELNRDQNASSLERVFRITGLPEQMQHAMRLIGEKAGIVSKLFYSVPNCAEFTCLRLVSNWFVGPLSKLNVQLICSLSAPTVV